MGGTRDWYCICGEHAGLNLNIGYQPLHKNPNMGPSKKVIKAALEMRIVLRMLHAPEDFCTLSGTLKDEVYLNYRKCL